jgi:hypothetical protein
LDFGRDEPLSLHLSVELLKGSVILFNAHLLYLPLELKYAIYEPLRMRRTTWYINIQGQRAFLLPQLKSSSTVVKTKPFEFKLAIIAPPWDLKL